MVPERDVDPAELYEQERQSLIALLRNQPAEALARTVEATPAWSVRDVLAHVVGITSDLNAQRFGDGDGDAWTSRQVLERAAHSLDELAAEWDREAPQFEAGLRMFGYDFGAHYLGDLLQHRCDVDAALGRCPARDDLAITVGLDFYLASLEETIEANGGGSLDVRVEGESWSLGRGPVIASVGATRYELFRALGGRRTPAQVASLGWSGDAGALIASFSRYPMPQSPLHEPP